MNDSTSVSEYRCAIDALFEFGERYAELRPGVSSYMSPERCCGPPTAAQMFMPAEEIAVAISAARCVSSLRCSRKGMNRKLRKLSRCVVYGLSLSIDDVFGGSHDAGIQWEAYCLGHLSAAVLNEYIREENLPHDRAGMDADDWIAFNAPREEYPPFQCDAHSPFVIPLN